MLTGPDLLHLVCYSLPNSHGSSQTSRSVNKTERSWETEHPKWLCHILRIFDPRTLDPRILNSRVSDPRTCPFLFCPLFWRVLKRSLTIISPRGIHVHGQQRFGCANCREQLRWMVARFPSKSNSSRTCNMIACYYQTDCRIKTGGLRSFNGL